MYPARTISVALFACPHCIDEFAFEWQRIRDLAYGWRIRVRCPGCRNIVAVMLTYTLTVRAMANQKRRCYIRCK